MINYDTKVLSSLKYCQFVLTSTYYKTLVNMKGVLFMAGWRSRYDREGQSNTDKYMGRKLHVQDNFWAMSKPLMILFILVLIYCIKSENLLDFSWVKTWMHYLR